VKNVEQIRTKTIRVMKYAIDRLRGLLSSEEEAVELVEAMKGTRGEEMLANVTDAVMVGLGHSTLVDSGDSQSHTRRAVRRQTRG
jgi:hypothetical protein